MKVTNKDNYIILEDDKNKVKAFSSFLTTHLNDDLKAQNIVVNLLKYGKLSLKELLTFLRLSNEQRGQKKSFVIVNDAINIDDIPDELMVVPSLQEAEDVVNMEDLERDMGVF